MESLKEYEVDIQAIEELEELVVPSGSGFGCNCRSMD